jgi:CelD/BcsL family acetyltransferase involved in cellulose biosynthesis
MLNDSKMGGVALVSAERTRRATGGEPSAAAEAKRWESGFRLFHTLGMFDYVASGAYRREPDFQRFLSAKSEHIRATGRDVNIWRYADEPLTVAP